MKITRASKKGRKKKSTNLKDYFLETSIKGKNFLQTSFYDLMNRHVIDLRKVGCRICPTLSNPNINSPSSSSPSQMDIYIYIN